MATQKIRTVIIGASGYTGGDFLRLGTLHPSIEFTGLVANTHAGKPVAEVFPHLAQCNLPDMVTLDEINWSEVDAVICGLPHGTAEEIIAGLPDHLRIIDMSADFRLNDAKTYAEWYGRKHANKNLLKDACYGLTELNRQSIKTARIIACPGCYPTAALLALLPLVKNATINTSHLILDAKSGVSGAGRSLKQNMLFCEAGEGLSPYAIEGHRHTPEIEQELSIAANDAINVTFVPHLVPMSRGELITCHLVLSEGSTLNDARSVLEDAYADEPFVNVAPAGVIPATQHVRGSNHCLINVFKGRKDNQIIVISTIDNLVKGSAGQAMQNFNVAFDLGEHTGLSQAPLFP